MSKKKTTNRLTLFRTCHICGKPFRTTADGKMRTLPNVDGQKYKNCYFCSERCLKASYKHTGWYTGDFTVRKEEQRKTPEYLEKNRERNRKYYKDHIEQMRIRARENYWKDPEAARAENRYYKKKRKLLESEHYQQISGG